VDARLDAKPSRAEPWFTTLRLWTASPSGVQKAKAPVIFTMVVFIGVVMIAHVIGVAVIPAFDGRAPLTLAPAEVASERRVSASRSASWST
jgi:hypothetical protein